MFHYTILSHNCVSGKPGAVQRELHDLTFFDALTKLPNRSLFNDRISQAITKAGREDEYVGLMILDIDRFKEINDILGYDAGDQLIKSSAERLTNIVRSYDTIARLGGDEFAIILPEISNIDSFDIIVQKIIHSFELPFHLKERETFIIVSIKIAIFPSDSKQISNLLQYADTALNHAKSTGCSGVEYYSTELTAKSQERLIMEAALRLALRNEEFVLHYQPQVNLSSGDLVGAEALIRWNNPSLGLVPPNKFIKLAEESGMIVEIGEWIIESTFRQSAAWNSGRKKPLRIALNLSTRQFAAKDFVERINFFAKMTKCDPHGWNW